MSSVRSHALAWLLCVVGAGLLPGCASSGAAEYPAADGTTSTVESTESAEAEWVSLPSLAGSLGLLVSDAKFGGGVALEDGRGSRILLFPHTGVATVRGARVQLEYEVHSDSSGVFVTAEDARTLQARWRVGAAAAAPAAPDASYASHRGSFEDTAMVVAPPPPEPLPPPPSRQAAPAPRIGTVTIDAGHGGKDPGALAHGITRETDVNLSVALSLARRLRERGANVVLTRDRDVFVDLEERARIGNRARSDLFVSIHADAAANRTATGFTVYVERRPSSQSVRAAKLVAKQLQSAGTRDRGVRNADYRVLVRSRGPAMLVELGFLSNTGEARRLATPRHRERLAELLARGITAYLGGAYAK